MRKTSLDELPQLINILKGDISVVGPRPVMDVETKIYGNYRNMLLSVKPGLTGFWQTAEAPLHTHAEELWKFTM